MKRFTIVAVSLGFIVVSLLIARPALTDQQSEKKTAEPTKVEQLQKERIEALEKIVTILKKQSETIGPASFTDFSKAQEEVIEAKLDATDKPHERIVLIKEQLKIAQDCFEFVEKQQKSGFAHVTETDSLHAKAHCLAVEIKLLKEQAAKNTTNSNENSDKRPKMTSNAVIDLANREATRQGYDLAKYETPKPHYEFTDKDRTWTVFYDGIVKKPGNHFQVWVNDENGSCKLMAGE